MKLNSIHYFVDLKSIDNNTIKDKFINLGLHEDKDTEQFVKQCNETFRSVKDGWKNLSATLLKSIGYSQTDANALTYRGEMFVISKSQLEILIQVKSSHRILLDIGAGDGSITDRFRRLFFGTFCTEASRYMKRILSSKKYTLLDSDLTSLNAVQHSFDAIFCFNVLDRCSKPLTLLKSMRHLLSDSDAFIVLAIVFPWCPFVEIDNKHQKPEEDLTHMKGYRCVDGASFEASLSQFLEKYIFTNGFRLVSWSKVPYISKGDYAAAFYTLEDAILVLKKKE